MNIQEINKLFITTKCEELDTDRGYLKYRYHVNNNIWAHITLLEEKFELLFVNYVGDHMYIVVDDTKPIGIPYTQYLSRQIHVYS